MKNPFRNLTDERTVRLNKQSLRKEQRQQEYSQAQTDIQSRAQEKHRYDDTVMDVLSQLQQAVYSELRLHSDDKSWSIGLWMKGSDGASSWHKTLDVSLAYDEVDGRALYFVCTRHNRQSRAELTSESLQQALMMLYPLEDPKDPRLARRAAKRRFDSIVKDAFDEFNKTAPKDLTLAGDAEMWSIGFWESRNESLEWKARVMIRLRFDWKNRPKGFHCTAGFRSARVGLSVTELSGALRKVFPLSSAD